MDSRYLSKYIQEDLKDKMVLLGGPRQVGKTTLSRDYLNEFKDNLHYYNWDNAVHQKALLKEQLPVEKSLVILDEIHKYSKWKQWLKGIYDVYHKKLRFLVTGSAKLNIYRRKGDSMLGRYHYYCLHPFSYKELKRLGQGVEDIKILGELKFDNKNDQSKIEQLLTFGGFPEPYTKQSSRFLRRWHQERIDLLVKDDIRSLEDIKDMSMLMIFAQMLPKRASQLLSINAIREDLSVSHQTVARWLEALEMVYYCHRIYPFSGSLERSLKKEPKLYLWDWSEIKDKGQKFENMIAGHLLKFVHFIRDYHGYKIELRYLRTREKKEVDFIVIVDEKPWFCVEVKLTDQTLSRNILYFKEKLNIPFCFQVVLDPNIDFMKNNVRVISAGKFLSSLV